MNGSRYPTWHLITGNYLAVMVSSVASEQAFSSAGITISKHRNRLDGDIVEAVQCLKSLNTRDLVLRVFPNVTDEEMLLDDADQQLANQEGSAANVVNDADDWTWEAVVEDAGDDSIDNVEDLS